MAAQNMTKIYDVTRVLSSNMPIYPGNPQPKFEMHLTLEKDGSNVSRIILGSHSGTHVDASWHFFQQGDTIDKEPINKFVGQAVIEDLSSKQIGSGINVQDLERYADDVKAGDILLIYTGTSDMEDANDERVRRNFTYLEPSAGEWLIQHGIKCVGIDTLSIEKYGIKEAPVHKMLLAKGIGIIENLSSRLKHFVGTRMFLVCLPLPLEGLDGSPARAVLVDRQEVQE